MGYFVYIWRSFDKYEGSESREKNGDEIPRAL